MIRTHNQNVKLAVIFYSYHLTTRGKALFSIIFSYCTILRLKMNVLIYSGPGTTQESVKHCLESLRLHLSPYYAVVTANTKTLLTEPWMSKTAMLVIPGGADLPYCTELNGEGNRRISQFVRKGGKFIGFCAGGYYASSRVEFEVGDKEMEVSGTRELKFFGGTAAGCAFKGFKYESHQGSRAVRLHTDEKFLPNSDREVYCYYNGGCIFKNASDHKVEVLATYDEATDIEDPEKAAIVYAKVGKGAVILSGCHPEFTPNLMHPSFSETEFKKTVQFLREHNNGRKKLMQQLLLKLGLRVNENIDITIPKLAPIYLSSYLEPDAMTKLMENLKFNLPFEGNEIVGNNDTFVFHEENEEEHNYALSYNDSGEENTEKKHIKVLKDTLPGHKDTPYFNMSVYFSHLKDLNGSESNSRFSDFGKFLGYSEVVTSTSTMLDGNPEILANLPNGFTFTATTQIQGRGRGGNVWINPKGVMASSFLFKLGATESQQSSIVTLQYLCSLAMVESILGYDSLSSGHGVGYEDMPVRIKWPNDIYSLKPEFFNSLDDKDSLSRTVDGDEERFAKISGTMINSQFLNKMFHLVCGIGVNVSNEAPTTSLNVVLDKLNEIRKRDGLPTLPYYRHELLLAKFMHVMNLFYEVFVKSGMGPFLPLYYKRWFHSSQIVEVIDNNRSRKCLVQGISPDYGLLLAKDVNTNEVLELQPDGNSFDIFKGLIYRKHS